MKLGVHEKVPTLFVGFVVKVLPVVGGEEADVSEVIAPPSGSPAITPKAMFVFSFPDADACTVIVGARSTFVTVTVVAAVADSGFDALVVTVYVPA